MLNSEELTRITDATWGDNAILMTLHCGTCGYNLRTLPYVYQCPECGHSYNARPDRMQGIFFYDQAKLPILDPFAVVVCAISALMLFGFGTKWGPVPPPPVVPIGVTPPPPPPFTDGDVITIMMGLTAVMLGAVYSVRAWRRIMMFLRGRDIIRRILAESEDE